MDAEPTGPLPSQFLSKTPMPAAKPKAAHGEIRRMYQRKPECFLAGAPETQSDFSDQQASIYLVWFEHARGGQ